MAVKKSSSKRSGASKGKAKVGKVMREYKRGELKSGSGRKVGNPKQAIAIGLSEARRAGATIPGKKAAAKKKPTAKKKATAKKPAAKNSAATKKTAARKTPAKRKSAARKR